MRIKKAQAWGIDLSIALIIFSIVITIFYFYTLNQSNEGKEALELLFYDGNIIAKSLFSEGYPVNWDDTNVVSIGILSDGKINETKLERFYLLAENDYDRTKRIFNTRFDYFFTLEGVIDLPNEGVVDGIGKPGTDIATLDSTNLVKITRFAVYDDTPVTAYIYVWEE